MTAAYVQNTDLNWVIIGVHRKMQTSSLKLCNIFAETKRHTTIDNGKTTTSLDDQLFIYNNVYAM